MTIRGTAARPGLSTPKTEKNCHHISIMLWNVQMMCTYRENNNEQEINVGHVVELQPQVLGYEADGGILCGPDFIPAEILFRFPVFVSCRVW